MCDSLPISLAPVAFVSEGLMIEGYLEKLPKIETRQGRVPAARHETHFQKQMGYTAVSALHGHRLFTV